MPKIHSLTIGIASHYIDLAEVVSISLFHTETETRIIVRFKTAQPINGEWEDPAGEILQSIQAMADRWAGIPPSKTP